MGALKTMKVVTVKMECLDAKMDPVYKNSYDVTVTLTVHSMRAMNWIVDLRQDRLDLIPLVSPNGSTGEVFCFETW